MDFQSAMETFAEAWVAANTREQTQALALTRSKSPILLKKERSPSPLQTSQNILRDTTGRTLQETLSPRYGGSSSGGGSGSSSGGVCGGGGGGSGVGIGIGIGTNSQQLSSPPTPLSDHHQNLANNNHQNNNNNNSNNTNNNNNQNSNSLNNLNNTNNNNNNNINNNNSNNSNSSNQNSHLQHQHQHHQRNTPNMPASSTTSSSSSSLNNNNNHSTNNTQKLCTTPTSSIMENGLIQTQNIANNLTNEKLLQSPSIERKDFDFSKTNAKSLPLHCIVESVSSLQASSSIDTRNLWKRRPNIETDSYVIIAASTPWSDIVTTALQRLGYSMDIANKARGSLVIKNWKPIPLENISDSPIVPVCEILGELTSVVTLRIVILRTKPSAFTEIKDKLLKLLVLQSHAVLRSTGCPLSEVTLSQICRGSYQNSFPFSGDIPEDICRKFDQWWANQLSPQSPITPKILPFIAPHHQNELDFTVGGGIGGGNVSSNGGGGVGGVSGGGGGGISGIIGNSSSSHSLHNSRENLLDNHHTTHPNLMVHPALQAIHSQYPNQKTRMRTSFDPEMELPKLQRWFQENPHPSRQQIQSYVIQLNSLESRRGRKPLDVNNVVYWFKNARAAQKRAEMRIQGLGNGYINHQQTGLLLNHPDYMKGSPSMKSDDIDNMSQHSDDIEDDSSRPTSPQLPLSLTTHERNRSTESNPEIKEENSMNSMERNNNNNNNNNNSNNSNNDGCHSTNNNNNNNGRRESVRDIDSNDNNLNSEQRSTSPKNSAKSDDDLDMDDNDMSQLDGFRTPSPDPRRDLTFPMVPNSMFSHSIMYMSHYMPGIGQVHHPHHTPAALNPTAIGAGNLNLSGLTNEERRKRNRTFIDPVTEVPKLEQWFAMNTHPSHNLILKYTEDLNRMPYRQKFPRLESKNVQFWFKNRRAKCKRLKMSLYDQPQCPQLSTLNAFAPKFDTPKFDGPHFDSPKYDERE